MADSKKTTLRNISRGPRGVNLADGGYLELAPNERRENVELTSDELASAKRTGYFAFGKAADDEPEAAAPAEAPQPVTPAPPAAPTPPTDDLDRMADDDLLNTAAAIAGKPVADLEGKDRDELLRIARGQA